MKRGDLRGVREILRAVGAAGINEYGKLGYTPLMYAVESSLADVEMVRVLLDAGADVHQQQSLAEGVARSAFTDLRNVVSLCLSGGDPGKLRVLIAAGADLLYKRSRGYDALVDAAHGRDIVRDTRLLELLGVLVERGVALDGETEFSETGLRVLANDGRFDAVGLLLDAGAPEAQLAWTPLIRAAALGSLEDMRLAADDGDLEGRDFWKRTAYLIAIQMGDIAKAALLRERGADAMARGRCGKPPLFYAIENHRMQMLEWLLAQQEDVEQTDDFGDTPLLTAIEAESPVAVSILLRAGADVNAAKGGTSPIREAKTAEIAKLLLEAGADPGEISYEARRALLGLPEADLDLLEVSAEEFQAGWGQRFGAANPERMENPFWLGMIRAGVTAYAGAAKFGRVQAQAPVWCAQRFGQSLTWLPDGRVIQIGGEHEDFYDRDFCIYNDVFVHSAGGVEIYGYPEDVFPVTDFHTATLMGDSIYVIGSLGYQGARAYGTTPVFRLRVGIWEMERMEIAGECPGWIREHRAAALGPDQIGVTGGTVVVLDGSEKHVGNERTFVLDVKRRVWY
ncbi:MAG: ankyrin repeat domain-containing protein [Acidobacteriota bacterium]